MNISSDAKPFQRLAVLGLGLLGGSVAAAAKERGLAREVVGAARRSGPLERALAAGIVDSVATPAEAVIGADLVVLGTPVGSMERGARGGRGGPLAWMLGHGCRKCKGRSRRSIARAAAGRRDICRFPSYGG